MFRRTLAAVGLSAIAVQGMAATLTTTPLVRSPQAIETAVNVAAGTSVMTTQAVIASGSVLNMTYSAAPSNPAAITLVMTGTCTDANDDLTYSGATNGGKTLNYTLIDGSAANVAAGCIVTTGATTPPSFKKADVTAGGITVSTSFTVVGAGVDPSPATAPKLLSLGTAQFTQTVAGANAVINVSAARKSFVAPDTSDTIVFTVGDAAGATAGNGATNASSKTVISGDFSWADNPLVAGFQLATGTIALTKSEGAGHVTVGTGVDKPTASTYTIVDTSPANGDTYTVTMTPPTGAAAVVLPVGAFTASTEVSYTDLANSTGKVTIAKSAGAFALNGATVKVFAVPFGSEVESHSIFVSNSGKTTGEVTGSMVWAGNDAVEFSLGNIEPKSNLYLPVVSALTAAGELPPFGRADITFTVNSPAADITMTAAYNTAEGRANLFMQEQANIASISSTASTQATTAATQSTAAATSAAAAVVDAACIELALSEGIDAGAASVVAGATTTGSGVLPNSTAVGEIAAAKLKYTGTSC